MMASITAAQLMSGRAAAGSIAVRVEALPRMGIDDHRRFERFVVAHATYQVAGPHDE
jgi:hypothetical protein